MKAILEFNLPEDRAAHNAALNGAELKSNIAEFDEWLRNLVKHTPTADHPSLANVRKQLWEFLRGLDPHDD